MNDVENLSHFDSEYLRDMFELSKDQSSEIFKNLNEQRVLETNQQKFFKVKRHINDRLLSEMDISDTNHRFVVEFEQNPDEYSGHELICSGTGSGKTYYCVQKILHNLNCAFCTIDARQSARTALRPRRQLGGARAELQQLYVAFLAAQYIPERSYKFVAVP